MTVNLVNFPGLDNYEDSGEGGLFVMLVVPVPDGYTNNCCVDVQIMMSSPDACVGDSGELWERYNYATSGYQKSMEAREIFKKSDRQDLVRWALRVRSADEFSQEVLASMHIGSSPLSLWSDRQGQYWAARRENLTDAGKVLYDTLHVAYGVEPVLLTFLDT